MATILVDIHGYHIPKEKIKMVHMCVDGYPNDKSKRQLFDWPQTDEYLQYLSKVSHVAWENAEHRSFSNRIFEVSF
ncbi:hypothetical protein [Paenibacillus sp. PL91]|uniref:hypothetical protein n=1 Tax=Paenibacillus sp. PL91 TaxID=2729538 RepID=UPI00145E0D2F|nr:hypothetical protein [Paenibacillus sp. PL91]MBC9205022.1 hypothetical protein [Paenibacillus sp. PL91]